MWITGIVKFWKSGNGKITDADRIVCAKGKNKFPLEIKFPLLQCRLCNVDGKLILFRKGGDAMNVIAVFMRNKNAFYLFNAKAQAF